MKNTYENLLRMTAETDPTERLCSNVMHKIEQRELAQARKRSAGFGLVAIATIVAIVPTVKYLLAGFAHSGAGSFVSLFLSDGGAVMSHWQEAIMSITDALPMTAIIATLALALICLASLRSFGRYFGSLRVHEQRLQLS